MPMYLFESASGETIEKSYGMKDAPGLGEKIKVDGIEYTRVLSRIHTRPEVRPYKVYSKHKSMARECGLPTCPKDGRPIIKNRSEEERVVKKLGLEAE